MVATVGAAVEAAEYVSTSAELRDALRQWEARRELRCRIATSVQFTTRLSQFCKLEIAVKA